MFKIAQVFHNDDRLHTLEKWRSIFWNGWMEDFVDAKIIGKHVDTKFFKMVNAIEKASRMI
jgi:hypothetical protein